MDCWNQCRHRATCCMIDDILKQARERRRVALLPRTVFGDNRRRRLIAFHIFIVLQRSYVHHAPLNTPNEISSNSRSRGFGGFCPRGRWYFVRVVVGVLSAWSFGFSPARQLTHQLTHQVKPVFVCFRPQLNMVDMRKTPPASSRGSLFTNFEDVQVNSSHSHVDSLFNTFQGSKLISGWFRRQFSFGEKLYCNH